MKRKWKWIWTLAAFALLLALPITGYASSLLDLGQSCTLTVDAIDPDNRNSVQYQEFAEDLDTAGVVIDLYKVADAVKVDGGWDSYRYNLLSPYAGLTITDDMNNEAWRIQARIAAQAALAGKPQDSGEEKGTAPIVTGVKPGETIEKDDSGKELYGGLYLMVARGADVADYVDTIVDEEGNEILATIACTDKYVYTFEPELISLPGIVTDPESLEEGSTYAWDYHPSAYFKPERKVRYGSLEIVKTLNSYEDAEPAMFVFDVTAVLKGKTVYSDVVSISFDAPGQKKALIEKLPVGAEVTVEEIYSGSCYTLEGEKAQTITVAAEGTSSVSFTNTYDGQHKGGHGITNHFSYDGDKGEWGLEQIR